MAADPTPRPTDAATPGTVRFEDGLGVRLAAHDPFGEPIEHLRVCPDLAAVEPAIRERIGRLINFRHARYVRLRGSERLPGPEKSLVIAYDAVAGVRLSQMLELTAHGGLRIELDAALLIVRELLPAMAVLHDSRNVTHGALGPERLVLTPQGRLVIVDHGLGLALGKVGYSRRKFWQQMRVAVPPGAGKVAFDARTDVVQIGMVALALVLGRLIGRDEYPQELPALIDGAREQTSRGEARPLPPALRGWLERALPTPHKAPFATVREAQQVFETLFAGKRAPATAATLKALTARYDALVKGEPSAGSELVEAATAAGASTSTATSKATTMAKLPAASPAAKARVPLVTPIEDDEFVRVKRPRATPPARVHGDPPPVPVTPPPAAPPAETSPAPADAFAALRQLEAQLAQDEPGVDVGVASAPPPLGAAPVSPAPSEPPTVAAAAQEADVAPAKAAPVTELSAFEQAAADAYADAARLAHAPSPPPLPKSMTIDAQAILRLTAVDDETPLDIALLAPRGVASAPPSVAESNTTPATDLAFEPAPALDIVASQPDFDIPLAHDPDVPPALELDVAPAVALDVAPDLSSTGRASTDHPSTESAPEPELVAAVLPSDAGAASALAAPQEPAAAFALTPPPPEAEPEPQPQTDAARSDVPEPASFPLLDALAEASDEAEMEAPAAPADATTTANSPELSSSAEQATPAEPLADAAPTPRAEPAPSAESVPEAESTIQTEPAAQADLEHRAEPANEADPTNAPAPATDSTMALVAAPAIAAEPRAEPVVVPDRIANATAAAPTDVRPVATEAEPTTDSTSPTSVTASERPPEPLAASDRDTGVISAAPADVRYFATGVEPTSSALVTAPVLAPERPPEEPLAAPDRGVSTSAATPSDVRPVATGTSLMPPPAIAGEAKTPERPAVQALADAPVPDADGASRTLGAAVPLRVPLMLPSASPAPASAPLPAPVVPPRRRLLSRINWRRTLAASLVLALLEGGAFATAYWFTAPTELGSLLVETTPAGLDILVDGRVVGKTPHAETLAPGRHTIELRLGASSRVIPVEISPGVQTMQRLSWSKGLKTGQARITSTPGGARVSIDGQEHGITPLTVSTLAAGRHTVVIVSDSGTVSAPLSISPGETTEMDVPVFPGWVSVLAPVELLIYEGERLLGTTEGEKLLLAPGRHTLTFSSEPLGYRSAQTVIVTPGATVAISIVLPKVPVAVQGPSGAELFIDGESAGTLPIDSVRASLGTRDFLIRHPQLGERRLPVTVTQKAPARVVFD